MLKVSIIEQRAREVSESRSYLQEQEYREQLNKVNQAFDAIKCIMPDILESSFQSSLMNM